MQISAAIQDITTKVHCTFGSDNSITPPKIIYSLFNQLYMVDQGGLEPPNLTLIRRTL